MITCKSQDKAGKSGSITIVVAQNVVYASKVVITGATKVNVGDVVGQLIIIPIPDVEFVEVDELDETDRGEGGFGSTEKPVEPVVELVVETPQPSKKKRGRKSKKK